MIRELVNKAERELCYVTIDAFCSVDRKALVRLAARAYLAGLNHKQKSQEDAIKFLQFQKHLAYEIIDQFLGTIKERDDALKELRAARCPAGDEHKEVGCPVEWCE